MGKRARSPSIATAELEGAEIEDIDIADLIAQEFGGEADFLEASSDDEAADDDEGLSRLLEDPNAEEDDGNADGSRSVNEASETSASVALLPLEVTQRNIRRSARLAEKFEVALESMERALADEREDLEASLPEWDILGLGLRLHPSILKGLSNLGFKHPTDIQRTSIPPAIEHRKDMLGSAETGSGKTLAFLIPVIQNLLRDFANRKPGASRRNSRPLRHVTAMHALVVLPSRELAIQVYRHFTEIAKFSPITSCCIIGGMFPEKQLRYLQNCPQVVIGTPGRLWALSQMGSPVLRDLAPSPHLQRGFSTTRYLVIDEADRMVERHHFRQLRFIMDALRNNRPSAARAERMQVFLFSATLLMPAKLCSSVVQKAAMHSGDWNGHMVQEVFKDLNLQAENLRISDLSVPLAATLSHKQSVVLPRRLEIQKMKCVEEEREFSLFMCLLRRLHDAGERPFKALVFVNSVAYTRRLVSLFNILLRKKLPLVQGEVNVHEDDPTQIRQRREKQVGKNNAKVKAIAQGSRGSELLEEIRDAEIEELSETLQRRNEGRKKKAEIIQESKTTMANWRRKQEVKERQSVEETCRFIGIHSDIKQSDRLQRLIKLTKSQKAVLICTDVAARGLDIPGVDLVIHFQPPRTAETFIHRSGRTARAFAAGECVCVCCPRDVAHWDRILRIIGRSFGRLPTATPWLGTLRRDHALRMKETFRKAAALDALVRMREKRMKQNWWLGEVVQGADLILDEKRQGSSDAKTFDARIREAALELSEDLRFDVWEEVTGAERRRAKKLRSVGMDV